MTRILVTGATGQLGSSVITTLRRMAPVENISVLTRNPEKRLDLEKQGFPAWLGSYSDISALENATKGVDTVLLISSGDEGDRVQEHKNVIDAAKKSGVKCVAYTSRSLRNPQTLENKLMKEHFATEDYLSASGIGYLIFRNALYMDAIPQFIGGRINLENGIALPAGDGRVAFALRSDLGEAIANILVRGGNDNHVYHLTGSESHSFYDVARYLAELTGTDVSYHSIEKELFEERLKQRNLPDTVIQKIADFVTDIKFNQEADIYPDLEEALRRRPATLKDGLKVIFNL